MNSSPPLTAIAPWSQREASEYAITIDDTRHVAIGDQRILRFDRIRVYCSANRVVLNERIVWATLKDGTRVRCDTAGFPSGGESLRDFKTKALDWARQRRFSLKRRGFFDAIDPLHTSHG